VQIIQQMKTKNFSITFSILFICAVFFQNVNGQTSKSNKQLIFYKNVRGPFWTKDQLDSFLISKTNNRYKLIPRITGSEQLADSLIYHITLIMDPAPVDENNKSLAGQELPAFNLTNLNGNKISPQSLKGKPVVINFWFTSCGPCIAEMPALNVLRNEYKDSDVVFISITFDKKIQILNFLKKHPFNFTIIPDARQYCDHITSLYPITLFVNKNGVIQYAEHLIPSSFDPSTSAKTRYLDLQLFEKNINSILAGSKN
jgi:peroxiredoxin